MQNAVSEKVIISCFKKGNTFDVIFDLIGGASKSRSCVKSFSLHSGKETESFQPAKSSRCGKGSRTIYQDRMRHTSYHMGFPADLDGLIFQMVFESDV